MKMIGMYCQGYHEYPNTLIAWYFIDVTWSVLVVVESHDQYQLGKDI